MIEDRESPFGKFVAYFEKHYDTFDKMACGPLVFKKDNRTLEAARQFLKDLPDWTDQIASLLEQPVMNHGLDSTWSQSFLCRMNEFGKERQEMGLDAFLNYKGSDLGKKLLSYWRTTHAIDIFRREEGTKANRYSIHIESKGPPALKRLTLLIDDFKGQATTSKEERLSSLDTFLTGSGKLILNAIDQLEVSNKIRRDDLFCNTIVRELGCGCGFCSQDNGAISRGVARGLCGKWLQDYGEKKNGGERMSLEEDCRTNGEWAERVAALAEKLRPAFDTERVKAPEISRNPLPLLITAEDSQRPEAEVLASLQPAIKRAWATWLLAEHKQVERPKDRQAYDWLNEQDDKLFTGDLAGYELPAYDTWAKQVRTARKALGKQKNTPRAGRSIGRSIARKKEF